MRSESSFKPTEKILGTSWRGSVKEVALENDSERQNYAQKRERVYLNHYDSFAEQGFMKLTAELSDVGETIETSHLVLPIEYHKVDEGEDSRNGAYEDYELVYPLMVDGNVEEMKRQTDNSERLRNVSCFNRTQTEKVLQDVAHGLDVLHEHKAVHSDLRLRNIFSRDGKFYLGDISGIVTDVSKRLIHKERKDFSHFVQCILVGGAIEKDHYLHNNAMYHKLLDPVSYKHDEYRNMLQDYVEKNYSAQLYKLLETFEQAEDGSYEDFINQLTSGLQSEVKNETK